MSDEHQTQAPAAPEVTEAPTATAPSQPPVDVDALRRSIEALERKNKELIDEKRRLRKYEQLAEQLPADANIQELIDFKRNHEQQQLKYQEARQALEQQFREATAQKDQRIAQLEARIRELELLTPAVTALADIVHDPDLVLKTKLDSNQIEREADGTVVVVNGYQRTPVAEWARATLPAWMQKQPKPQGSGAPVGSSTSALPAGMKNPFSRESFNLTEQARLYRTDRDLYDRMKAAANR
jgi:hypothetical protein